MSASSICTGSDHHRSAMTSVAEEQAALEGAVRGVERAAALIDLNRHTGEHPRIGAADVVPFVPFKELRCRGACRSHTGLGEEIYRRCGRPGVLLRSRGAAARANPGAPAARRIRAVARCGAPRSFSATRCGRAASASDRWGHRGGCATDFDRLQHPAPFVGPGAGASNCTSCARFLGRLARGPGDGSPAALQGRAPARRGKRRFP